MLKDAPSAPIWAGMGAKAHTSDIASDPTTEMPTNLKLRRTDFRDGPNGTSNITRRLHRFAYQNKRHGSGGAEKVFLSPLARPKGHSRISDQAVRFEEASRVIVCPRVPATSHEESRSSQANVGRQPR